MTSPAGMAMARHQPVKSFRQRGKTRQAAIGPDQSAAHGQEGQRLENRGSPFKNPAVEIDKLDRIGKLPGRNIGKPHGRLTGGRIVDSRTRPSLPPPDPASAEKAIPVVNHQGLSDRGNRHAINGGSGAHASSPQGHVQDHHHGKSNHDAQGCDIAIPLVLRFGDQLFHDDEDHGPGRKGQRIRQQRLG